MTTTGIDDVTGRLNTLLDNAKASKTEGSLTEALISGGAFAAHLTPVATSALINSQERKVQRRPGGWRGTLYYGAFYAPFVHAAPGTLKGQMVPRYPQTDGFVWDPNGEPEFLKKGMERMADEDLPGILQRNYGV